MKFCMNKWELLYELLKLHLYPQADEAEEILATYYHPSKSLGHLRLEMSWWCLPSVTR